MVTGAEFKVDGLGAVVRGLRGLGDDLGDLKSAFAEIAQRGARAAAARAPHRSGRLAGSLRGSATPNRATVTTTVPYAGPINYGWPRRNIAASGFMQQADQEIRPHAVRLLEDDIDRSINRRDLS